LKDFPGELPAPLTSNGHTPQGGMYKRTMKQRSRKTITVCSGDLEIKIN